MQIPVPKILFMLAFISQDCLSLGCYNQVSQAEDPRNNKNVSFTVLEAGSLKSG